MKETPTADQAREALAMIQSSRKAVLQKTVFPGWMSVYMAVFAFLSVAHRVFAAPGLESYENISLIVVVAAIFTTGIVVIWLRRKSRVISTHFFTLSLIGIILVQMLSHRIMQIYGLYWLPLPAGLITALVIFLLFEWHRKSRSLISNEG